MLPMQLCIIVLASTEPHSLECGELLEGKPQNHLIHSASTEPHSLECGEVTPQARWCRRQDSLQRSRTRWSAESLGGVLVVLQLVEASTEPHSLECGEKRQNCWLKCKAGKLQRSRTRWSAESYILHMENISPI